MEERNNSKGMSAVTLTLFFSFVIYVLFSLLAIYCYGEGLDPNIFVNLQAEGSSFESYFIRVTFLLILLCNIPYLFLPGKVCLLIMIEELRTRKMST